MRGVDMFDCGLAQRIARNGMVFSRSGRWFFGIRNMKRTLPDRRGLRLLCLPKLHKGVYPAILIQAGEIMGARLCTIHNLHFLMELMKGSRGAFWMIR
jgi:queuine tRNA-ribosyltransferase